MFTGLVSEIGKISTSARTGSGGTLNGFPAGSGSLPITGETTLEQMAYLRDVQYPALLETYAEQIAEAFCRKGWNFPS